MRRILIIISLLIFASTMLLPLAEAEPITFKFEGFVSSTNKPTIFPIGQQVTGSYTFESTTPDSNPGNPDQGVYSPIFSYPLPPTKGVTSFSFTTGSYSATALAPNVVNGGGEIIVNNFPVNNFPGFPGDDSYQVFIMRDSSKQPFGGNPRWGPDVNGEELLRMWLVLQDTTGTAITTIDLPLTPPNLNNFTSAALGLFFEFDATGPEPPDGGGIVFTITSIVGGGGAPIDGDLNGDGKVDINDFKVFQSAFGACTGKPKYNPAADYDKSGCINFVDYQTWYQYYLQNKV